MSLNLGLHQHRNVFVYNKGILLLSFPIQNFNIPVHLAYLFFYHGFFKSFDRVSNGGHFSKHLILLKPQAIMATWVPIFNDLLDKCKKGNDGLLVQHLNH
jgi:hypothetical protein